jgi:hypothetical protein
MFQRALKNRDDAFWTLEKAADALVLRPGSILSHATGTHIATKN